MSKPQKIDQRQIQKAAHEGVSAGKKLAYLIASILNGVKIESELNKMTVNNHEPKEKRQNYGQKAWKQIPIETTLEEEIIEGLEIAFNKSGLSVHEMASRIKLAFSMQNNQSNLGHYFSNSETMENTVCWEPNENPVMENDSFPLAE